MNASRPRLVASGALAVLLLACPPPPSKNDSGQPDGGEDDDAGMMTNDAGQDAGVDAGSPDGGYVCIEDNSPASLTARDGFEEVCASPSANPDARCGDGSPFKFTLRPASGTSKGLLLFFRGGGECSDYVGCWGTDGRGGGAGRRVATLSNTQDIAPTFAMGKALGIFDGREASNAFREYDQVHVSSCTGDLGEGTMMQTFTRPANADMNAPEQRDTYFHGDYDLRFALSKAHARFASPARIVLYGAGTGSYAALHALPLVMTQWSAGTTIPVRVVTEGGMGVGVAARETALRALLSQYDGQAGRPLVRFGQLTFISDATQRSFAPAAYQAPAAFQAELRNVVQGRDAVAPSNYRSFAVNGACNSAALSPGYWLRFVIGPDNRLVPADPVVRPNPDLTLSMVSFDAWVKALVEGSGPFTTDVANLSGDWVTVSTSCLVP